MAAESARIEKMVTVGVAEGGAEIERHSEAVLSYARGLVSFVDDQLPPQTRERLEAMPLASPGAARKLRKLTESSAPFVRECIPEGNAGLRRSPPLLLRLRNGETMTCSYCGHAGAGVRLLPTAFVCGKALCQKLAMRA